MLLKVTQSNFKQFGGNIQFNIYLTICHVCLYFFQKMYVFVYAVHLSKWMASLKIIFTTYTTQSIMPNCITSKCTFSIVTITLSLSPVHIKFPLEDCFHSLSSLKSKCISLKSLSLYCFFLESFPKLHELDQKYTLLEPEHS